MQERLIGQRYRLAEKIGSGGMADVYRAVDETLGRNVAVKIMHERYTNDPTFTARFRQEAQAAANLSSPYIVNIYDWGQEDNTYYIVMELVRGTDLKTIIRERGPLPSREVADIGAQVCSALATAHSYDIIHRDIKPHNIMITPDHNVKVMDFGIARAGNTTLTQTGSVLGSAHYVSPEQAQGRQLTPASDLYSLGVVLYEAATGKMPFDGDTPIATALKQVNEQPIRPSRINSQIDPNLEMVIGYALAKDPHARYATANAMRGDLVRVVRGEPIVGANATAAGIGSNDATQLIERTPVSTGAASAPDPADQTTVMPQVVSGTNAAVMTTTQDKKKSKAWIWILLVALLVAGILAAGYLLGWFTSNQKTVPDLQGKTVAEATQLLNEQSLKLGTQETTYSATVPKDQIVSQDPPANSRVEPQTKVNIVVSQGQEIATVPDVSKQTLEDATKTLEQAGFQVKQGDPENSPDIDAKLVIRQTPTAGSQAPKGTIVTIILSLGKEMGTVPDVSNLTSDKAQSLLTDAGFNVTINKSNSDTVSAGNVIDQSISGGTSTPKGTMVTITVSLGPAPVQVPANLVGMNWQAAVAQINAAGLVCDPTKDIVWAATDNTNQVVKVGPPAAGSSVAKGTHVKLTVDGTQ